MYKGKVKSWFVNKGFGFILPDDSGLNEGRDVFVHISACGGKALEPGAAVSFSYEKDKRSGKMCAQDVTLLG